MTRSLGHWSIGSSEMPDYGSMRRGKAPFRGGFPPVSLMSLVSALVALITLCTIHLAAAGGWICRSRESRGVATLRLNSVLYGGRSHSVAFSKPPQTSIKCTTATWNKTGGFLIQVASYELAGARMFFCSCSFHRIPSFRVLSSPLSTFSPLLNLSLVVTTMILRCLFLAQNRIFAPNKKFKGIWGVHVVGDNAHPIPMLFLYDVPGLYSFFLVMRFFWSTWFQNNALIISICKS